MINYEQENKILTEQLKAANANFETLSKEYNLLLQEVESLTRINDRYSSSVLYEAETVFRISTDDVLYILTDGEPMRSLDEIEDAVAQEVISNFDILNWRDTLKKEIVETLTNYRNNA